MTLGERIRKLRNENHLTQLELAKKLDVPYHYIHPYEYDQRVIPMAMIEALACALNTTTEYLLGQNEQTEDTCKPSSNQSLMIGEKIKALRKAHHMTAEALGVAIGKDRATVYRYENGELDDPPISIILSLCDAFQVAPSELLGVCTSPPAERKAQALLLTRHNLYELWHVAGIIEGLIVHGGECGISDDLTFVSDTLVKILCRVDPDPQEEKEE